MRKSLLSAYLPAMGTILYMDETRSSYNYYSSQRTYENRSKRSTSNGIFAGVPVADATGCNGIDDNYPEQAAHRGKKYLQSIHS